MSFFLRVRHATLYKQRNWIERPCNKLKHWRRLATRSDRKTTHFLAFLYLAALPLWVPSMSIQPRFSPMRRRAVLLCSGRTVRINGRGQKECRFRSYELLKFRAKKIDPAVVIDVHGRTGQPRDKDKVLG